MKKFVILLDSSASVPLDIIEKYDFKVVPLSISDQNDKIYADDGIQITMDSMISMMDNGYTFKTSATQMGILMNTIDELLKKYENVIFIPISEGLSSQTQQALTIQDEYNGRFHVLKSNQAISVNEWAAITLWNELSSGKTIQSAMDEASKVFDKTVTYFSCEDASGMLKSGRVPKAIAKIVEILKIKPIMYLDMKIKLASSGKKFEAIVEKIIKLSKKNFVKKELMNDSIEEIAIYDGKISKEKLEIIKRMLIKEFKILKDKIICRKVPLIVLSHTHKGAFGISIKAKINKLKNKYDE